MNTPQLVRDVDALKRQLKSVLEYLSCGGGCLGNGNACVNEADLEGQLMQYLILKQNINTGFIFGLQLRVNADDNKLFDLLKGFYVVTTYNNLPEGQAQVNVLEIEEDIIGISPKFLNTRTATFIGLDVNKQIIQKDTEFTEEERRTIASMGSVIHSNKTFINTTNEIKDTIVAGTNQIHDIARVLGNLNLEGNEFGAGSQPMSISKSAGIIFGYGINGGNYLNPFQVSLAERLDAEFRYRLSDSQEFAPVFAINPNIYEIVDNPSSLDAVPNNKYTIQQIFVFQSNEIRIQPGQKIYANMEEAKALINTDKIKLDQNISERAIFRAFLIIKEGVTDLATAIINEEAAFVPVDRWGNAVGGAGVVLNYNAIVSALGYVPENEANKVTDFSVVNNINYPTTQAMVNKFVTLDTWQTITGRKTFDVVSSQSAIIINNTYGAFAVYLTNNSTSSLNSGFFVSHNSPGSAFYAQNQSYGFGVRVDNQANGTGITSSTSGTGNAATFGSTSTGVALRLQGTSTGDIMQGYNGATTLTSKLTKEGNFTANSFIKSGGTSAQFLKADGSVDTNVYQTLLTNPLTGSLTNTYIPKANAASSLVNSSMYENGSSMNTTLPMNIGGLVTAKGAELNPDDEIVSEVGYFKRLITSAYTSYFTIQSQYYNGSSYSGTYGVGVGRLAAYQNRAAYITAVGTEAARYNTGNNSVGVGHYALRDNTGASVVAVGYQSATGNTASSCTGVGASSLQNNTGAISTGVGDGSLASNAGSSCSGVGAYSLRYNVGISTSGVGESTLMYNVGHYVAAIGNHAGRRNIGANCTFAGYIAGNYNVGYGITALGTNSGEYNVGGNTLLAGGYAGRYNISSSSIGIGDFSLQYAQGSNNVVLGHGSYTSFLDNTAGNKTFDYTAIDTTAKTIVVTAHGFGSNGSYVNLRYTQGTSSISGWLTNQIIQFKILDANTLVYSELLSSGQYRHTNNITNAGTGTGHTLTPQFAYSNVNIFGSSMNPTMSNQTIIGNTTTVQAVIYGTRAIVGTIADDDGSTKFQVAGKARIATVDNGAGNFVTLNGTNVLTKRTAEEARADMNAAVGALTRKDVTGTTYTILATDFDKRLYTTNAADVTITVPSGLPAGREYEIIQYGDGQVIIVGSGTTLRYSSYVLPKTEEKYSIIVIKSIDTETYKLFGELASF